MAAAPQVEGGCEEMAPAPQVEHFCGGKTLRESPAAPTKNPDKRIVTPKQGDGGGNTLGCEQRSGPVTLVLCPLRVVRGPRWPLSPAMSLLGYGEVLLPFMYPVPLRSAQQPR